MVDLRTPPVMRYRQPLIDAHVHIRGAKQTQLLLEAGRLYNISHFCGIGDVESIAACRDAFPGRFFGILRATFEDVNDAGAFKRRVRREIETAVSDHEIRGIKFWFKPQFNAQFGMYWDDARLDSLFEVMVEHDLVALIHIADPDIWFKRVYGDVKRYRTKLENYEQLENRLRRSPGLKVQAAHLGGDPEHLDHLRALLLRHEELYFDLSATKWLARELSRKPEESRAFIMEHANRLLWGSDLVVGRYGDMSLDDYVSRYYVHRHLWEGQGPLVSPIEDTDAAGPVTVHGLNLPLEVLEKVYCRNAEKLYRMN